MKSSGVDEIPIEYLLISAQIITLTLTCLFNNCIQAGIYPQTFKIGQIVPIFKNGAKDQCMNYSPRYLFFAHFLKYLKNAFMNI